MPGHGTAQLAFVHGPVATMDPNGTVTDALAVRDGRITGLGATVVRAQIGTATEVIDLRGRLLLPGFQDAHAHPVYGGLERLRCDLVDSADLRECLRRIETYARTSPGHWIWGGGWETALFPNGSPSRHALDTVTGDRPAFLLNQDHHDAWVNTAALALAGIDRHTPDPSDGRVSRESDGSPSGVLHEGAIDLVARFLPPATGREYRDGFLEGQRYLHECGVTSWQDAIVGPYAGYADTLPMYTELDRLGLLTGRVHGALWWDRHRGAEQIGELIERRRHGLGARFRANSVKIMLDGVCENHSAALLNPYLGTHDSGHSFVAPGALAEVVTQLDAEQFALHFHAVGDRAVQHALDAIARAKTANPDWDSRHQIAHVQLVNPSDVARFHTLGVTANIQARWAVNDAQMTELTTPYLGSARARRQYPFEELRAAGAPLAAGSDWPVSGAEPMRAIHVAVNRSEPDEDVEPFLPEQALDLDTALRAYTVGSARANQLDQRTGTLEYDKLADLVILDRNPYELPAAELGHAQVDLTLVDGRVVYARSP